MTMSDETEVTALLTAHLNPAALLLGDATANYTVVAWETPLEILKKNLLNKTYNLVFSVKPTDGVFKRFLQLIPHTYKHKIDVDVWLTENYPYSATADYMALRNAAVAEIQRIFLAYPTYGDLTSTRRDDHLLGTVKVYNSTVTVTKQTYS